MDTQHYQYLCTLLKKLIDKNQSDSILISGDAGVGKTTMVESCLAKFPLLADHSVDTKGKGPRKGRTSQRKQLKTVVFRFDGYLHGKNEPALLRQIGKRLNEFFDKEEQIFVDDLDETFDCHEDDEGDLVNLKVSRSIPKIMNLFKTLVDRVSAFRAVIILDQFEMFCSKQQHLLYNLFDLIQYGKGVLIIGITRVLECHQLLISRVQSRLNQRYIHLSSPLDTIEKYKQFCEQQIKIYYQKNPAALENFQNRENFEEEIKKNFSLSRTYADAKKFVFQSSFVPKPTHENKPLTTVALKFDTKVIDLINLTKNELVVLLVANRSLRSLDVEVFNPRDLYQWTSGVACMKQFKFQQLIKAIYMMLEADLIIYAKEVRSKTQLSLTPWTKLRLNISDFQLKELIDKLGNKLPTYVKQLLN